MRSGWRLRWRGRLLAAAATGLLVSAALAACSAGGGPAAGSASGAGGPPSTVASASVPGAQSTTFTAAEESQAAAWANGYAAGLAAAHPQLAGLKVQGLYPVFDQGGAAPIGVLARLEAPTVVPSVDLDLIRFADGSPQLIPAEVRNLRELEAIYEFASATVVHLDIAPLPGDADDPSTATQVIPLPGQQKSDPRFGGSD